MKVSTTLEKMQYDIEKQQLATNKVINEKKLKSDYIAFLKNTITDNISIEFVKNEDSKETYNNLILNSDYFQDKIIKEISDVHYVEENKFKNTKKNIYIYDSFDIMSDVGDYYFQILEKVYKEYKIKEKVIKENVKDLLESNFKIAFEDNDYNKCINYLYNKSNKEDIIDTLSTNKIEKKYLDSIYFKALKKYENQYKTSYKINNTKNKKKKSKGVGYIIGGAIIGTLSGFIKATKKK